MVYLGKILYAKEGWDKGILSFPYYLLTLLIYYKLM
jgi:hypothetical protein